MRVFGYPYILYFVLHGLNSMRPRNMYMHLWNDVIAGLDSGLLTIGAKALSKPMPNQIPDMLTNTNSFEIVTFRIISFLLLTNSYSHYLRTCSDKQESFTCKRPWRSCYFCPPELTCSGARVCLLPQQIIISEHRTNVPLAPWAAMLSHGAWSIWVWVKACCLTSPIHHLNQYWLARNGFLSQSPEYIFTGNDPDINISNEHFELQHISKGSMNHNKWQNCYIELIPQCYLDVITLQIWLIGCNFFS